MRRAILKAVLSRLMHICYAAIAEIESQSWRNILSKDKLTNTNRFINRSVLDNRVSLFRVHFTVSYSQIYCGYRSEQAFHTDVPRAYFAYHLASPYPINQIFALTVSRVSEISNCSDKKYNLQTKEAYDVSFYYMGRTDYLLSAVP